VNLLNRHGRNTRAGSFWPSALRAAAVVARKAASSEEDILRAFTQELRRLGMSGSVALLNDQASLVIKTRSMSRIAESTLSRLSGFEITGYEFDPQTIDAYRQALESGEPVYSEDRSVIISQLISPNLRSLVPVIMRILGDKPVIVAPLILEDQPLGTINVTAHWLTRDDLPMVAALADHIAIALGHVRSREEMQAALERQRLRNQVAEVLASSLDLPAVLEQVVQLAVEVTGADAGTIGLLEGNGDTVGYPHITGLPDEFRTRPSSKGKGVVWQLLNTGKPMLLDDYRRHPQAEPAWIDAGLRASIAVPLQVGNEIIGGLGLFHLSRQSKFTQEQLEMAQAIANMAAIAIKNVKLIDDAMRRAEESQALIRTARSISSSLDLDTVLHRIAEEAKQLLHADASRIHLLDPERGKLRCVVALDPRAEAVMAFELDVGQGLTGYAVESGEPLMVNEPLEDPRSVQIPGTPEEEPEVLALAPLIIRQRTMGAMTVLRLGLDRPFSSSDLNLLTAFAAQAAVTLENAHLFGQIAEQALRLEQEVLERTQELARSESHYRALVETSLAGILQVDQQGRFVYVNQRFAEMLEVDPDDLVGKHITDYKGFVPEIHQSILDRFEARMRGERVGKEIDDIELFTSSGKRIPALLAISVIKDDDGQTQGVTGLVLDISQQKALEAALQAERDRLDALLTNIGDAVIVTDAEGVIEYVNPGWERLNGYSASEALGEKPSLIQSGEHPPQFYTEMWRTISSGRTWRGEVVNRRKDGAHYDAALTITPVMDEAGNVINYVGVQHDISALKEVDRLKSQFVSDVSHELRTPLTNIRLYLDLLAKTPDDPVTSTRYLETLSRESERLASLIDDLLSLSRLDAEAIPFDPKPLDLETLLKALADDRKTMAAKRGIRLSMNPNAPTPITVGDDRLLTQVFTNLLTNAMNYTPHGGEIVLRTDEMNVNGKIWILAEVKDTGLGITTEEMPQIFGRFFRGSASQTTNAPGTGLGLAICKEIVERHGGRITVESEGVPGRGSCFTVWLPRATRN
jgi:PAS domain S-box-containing protein